MGKRLNLKRCPNCKNRKVIITPRGLLCPECGCEVIMHERVFTDGPRAFERGKPVGPFGKLSGRPRP